MQNLISTDKCQECIKKNNKSLCTNSLVYLKWTKHVTKTVSSCFAALSAIKKISNIAPKFLNKQLVEALLLSKVDYVDFVVYPLPQCLEAKLQRLFKTLPQVLVITVMQKWLILISVLGWLPVKERTEMHLLRTIHRVIKHFLVKQFSPAKTSNNYEPTLVCYTAIGCGFCRNFSSVSLHVI